ncbi:hypothetical protein AgCh_030630 [Apium graveolens]
MIMWILDNGCSRHIIGETSLLTGFTKGYGKLEIGNVIIENISLVEGLKHNLLSVSQFCDKRYNVDFRPERCLITHRKDEKLALQGKLVDYDSDSSDESNKDGDLRTPIAPHVTSLRMAKVIFLAGTAGFWSYERSDSLVRMSVNTSGEKSETLVRRRLKREHLKIGQLMECNALQKLSQGNKVDRKEPDTLKKPYPRDNSKTGESAKVKAKKNRNGKVGYNTDVNFPDVTSDNFVETSTEKESVKVKAKHVKVSFVDSVSTPKPSGSKKTWVPKSS